MNTPDDKAEKTAKDAPDPAPGADLPADPATAAGAPESGPPDDPEGAALDHKLRAWLSGHIAGGPIARNTDCWNALVDALPALKAQLSER